MFNISEVNATGGRHKQAKGQGSRFKRFLYSPHLPIADGQSPQVGEPAHGAVLPNSHSLSAVGAPSSPSPTLPISPSSLWWRHIKHHVCLGILLPFALFGCTPSNSSNPAVDGKPQVVATSTIIADLAEEVGGDEIQLRGILQPGTDPHVYEPRPQDSKFLEEADLILYNGYNLEPGLIKLMNAAGTKARKLAVGEVAKPLQLDKGKGEVVPDPHVWGDVKNAIAMVNAIRDALIELSPADKAEFTQKAQQLTTELKQLDSWITQQIQTIPPDQRKLVTTHDAFQYYGRAYNIPIVGTLIGISTEEQPSAQTVKQLVELIKKIGVPAIFAETTINPTLIKTVAQEAGVKLAPRQLYSDSIGAPGSDGDSYSKMMQANTQTIVEALVGKYTPFQPAK